MVILCLCACLLSRWAPPSMQFIEAPSSQHPLCERASRWRGPFTANWPWQSLIETHFLSPFPSLLPRRQESSPPSFSSLLHSQPQTDTANQCAFCSRPEKFLSLFRSFLCPSCLSPPAFLSSWPLSVPKTGWRHLPCSAEPLCLPFVSSFLLSQRWRHLLCNCFLSHVLILILSGPSFSLQF